ncbi:hypothetical protein PPROV_000577400 [Pycnococcus provasolii]|uniref:PTM/DIR17-like Tudor domain-containing protein n=1 Tax=Pycnococcus provasolii TaxID=41880 RepID=A0A830HNE1_9CHLO|nr:hypothetical protein PPROV_000577400 [Pycnococcus provasolii]
MAPWFLLFALLVALVPDDDDSDNGDNNDNDTSDSDDDDDYHGNAQASKAPLPAAGAGGCGEESVVRRQQPKRRPDCDVTEQQKMKKVMRIDRSAKNCRSQGLCSSMIGMRIRKQFGSQFFSGKVDGCDPIRRWYHVTYTDGDKEEMGMEELLRLRENNIPMTFAHGDDAPDRVLGVTPVTSKARGLWRACWKNARNQRSNANLECGVGGFQITSIYDANEPEYLSSANLIKSISAYLIDLGVDLGAAISHGMTPALPKDAPPSPFLEQYTVPASDPREGLHGQLGCRVRSGCSISAGTTLGVYTGEMLTTDEVYSLPSVQEAKRLGPIEFLQAEMNAESFTEEMNNFNAYNASLCDGAKLAVCAVNDSRGLMHRINDVRLNPMTPTTPHAMLPGGKNVEYVETLVCGLPFVFLVARCDLSSGMDLRGDYQDAYWELLRGLARRIKMMS